VTLDRALREVRAAVEQARTFGYRQLSDGTELVGHTPHVGPDAWFHVVFPPIAPATIDQVEHEIGRSLPGPYREFLQAMNGVSLFAGSMSLYGHRRNFQRTGDAVWQPFSIRTPNTVERPRDAAAHLVFVGGYKADGSRLYIDGETLQVHLSLRESTGPVATWKSFSTFLEEELARLRHFFDDKGRRIGYGANCAPSPVSDVKSVRE
jgi:hypothetical protein